MHTGPAAFNREMLPLRNQVARCRAGFTLIDVLVSLSVIMVLIAIVMPSISMVRETGRRVVCASNVRQHGLGVAMYSEDYRGEFPRSVFASANPQLQNTLTVRLANDAQAWDGLGVLFDTDYLNAPGIYYCPSHWGRHQASVYAGIWPRGNVGEIVSNYQYRALGPDGERLTLFAQPALALIVDGMRTVSDYSHKVGANVMRVDLSVAWFSDPLSRLGAMLPESPSDVDASDKVEQAWEELDGAMGRR